MCVTDRMAEDLIITALKYVMQLKSCKSGPKMMPRSYAYTVQLISQVQEARLVVIKPLTFL